MGVYPWLALALTLVSLGITVLPSSACALGAASYSGKRLVPRRKP